MGSSSISRIKQSTIYLFKNKQTQRIAISFTIIVVALLIFLNQNRIKTFLSKGSNPVAYWKLDEGTGSTTYDSSGINTGTLASGVSAPLWTSTDQCVSGRCLFFDGTNDYVTLGTGLSSNTSNLGSISLWFRSTRAVQNSAGMMFYVSNSGYPVGDGFGGDFELHVDLNASKQVNFYIEGFGGTDVNITSSTAYTDNKWHHVTATWDKAGSGFAYLYVDGISVGSGSMSGVTSYTLGANAYLGRSGAADNYRMFGGYLDEVKFYNYARTSDQVKTDAVGGKGKAGDSAVLGAAGDPGALANGLVGYWKMDEVGVSGPSWTAVDSSGHNNYGIGAGNASVGITAPGKFGNAGFFDGGGDWVDLASNINLSTVHTLSFWLNYWNAGDAVVLGNVNGQYGAYIDGPSSGGAIYYRPDPSSSYVSVVHGGLTQGTWYHFTIVRNGRDVTFYKNGVKLGATQTLDSNYDLVIDCFGANCNSSSFPLYGLLDEVRLYNRAFDQSAINTLYTWAPGPVAYWKMDEKSGTTISDLSGNGYTGTFGTGNSSPSWNTGKYGNAVKFDGTNDYITIGDDSTLVQTGPLTLSAWIKTTDTVNNDYIVSKYRAVFGQRGYALITTAGKLQLLLGNADDSATSVTSNTTVATGSWVHVAGVIGEDNIMRLYINGVQDITASYTGTRQTATNEIQIGAYGDSDLRNSFFNGSIDEVKVYNYARSAGQIAEDVNAGHPVVGTPVGATILHLKMDEGYGTTVNDWSPQNFDGTFGSGNSAPTWTNDGKFGKAVTFDGTNDAIFVADNDTLDIGSGDLTVSYWIKKTSQRGGVAKGTMDPTCGGCEPVTGYALIMHSNDRVYFTLGVDASNRILLSADTTGFVTSTTEWNHLVGTWNNASQTEKIYINGRLAATKVGADFGTVTSLASSYPLVIGCLVSVYCLDINGFKGSIDEVKIYPATLTADQVKLEYNQGKSLVLGSKSTASDGTTPDNSSSREYCVPGDTSTCSAPIAEWNFNEGVGVTANDTSTNRNAGTLTSGPIWTQGRYGSSIKFDGNDDHVVVTDPGTSSIFDFASGESITIEAWIKPRILPALNTYYTVLTKGASAGADNSNYLLGYGYNGTNYQVEFCYNESGVGNWHCYYGSTPSFAANQWQHIAVTYTFATGSSIKTYYNGSLLSGSWPTSSGNVAPEQTNADLWIGAVNYSGGSSVDEPADGAIDDVKIYDYARTAAQIAWKYNKGAPVAWYKMNEGTGTTVGDWGPNGNGGFNGHTGTMGTGNSAPSWTTSGKYGSALDFDGTADYVEIADNDDFDFSGDFSIMAWVKADTLPNDKRLISKWGSAEGERAYLLQYGNSPQTFLCGVHNTSNVPTTVSPTLTILTSTWYHVACIRSNNVLYLYVNGVLKGNSSTITGTQTTNTTPIRIGDEGSGATYSPNQHWDGQIDDVRLYNHALTSSQLNASMNDGATNYQ